MKRRRKVYKKTVSIVNETATGMYESLVGKSKGFLLESYDKNYDRYVFMGKNPEEIIQTEKNRLLIHRKDGTTMGMEGNPMDLLKVYYSDFEIRQDGTPLAFTGGLVGALGYDFVRYQETLPDNNPDEIGIETIQMMLMTEFLVMDYVGETLTAIVLGEDSEEGREKSLLKAQDMIERARRKPEEETAFHHDGVIVAQSDTLEEYSKKVNKIKEYIREGHIFQTVLSQRWTIETGQDGFALSIRS